MRQFALTAAMALSWFSLASALAQTPPAVPGYMTWDLACKDYGEAVRANNPAHVQSPPWVAFLQFMGVTAEDTASIQRRTPRLGMTACAAVAALGMPQESRLFADGFGGMLNYVGSYENHRGAPGWVLAFMMCRPTDRWRDVLQRIVAPGQVQQLPGNYQPGDCSGAGRPASLDTRIDEHRRIYQECGEYAVAAAGGLSTVLYQCIRDRGVR